MKFFYIFLLSITSLGLHAKDYSDTNRLSVNGEWVLHRPADKATIKLGVISSDKNVEAAIQENAEKMKKILIAIKEKGLTEQEIKSGSFTVTPQRTVPPRDPPPGWRADITGYEVRNTLSLTTINLEMVGSIIDAAAKEGANLFDGVAFSLQDPQTVQTEAISKAVQQARNYADSAAQAANVVIEDVMELNINPAHVSPRAWQAQNYSANASEISTIVNPGEVDVTASVSIVFEIRHK